MVKRLRDHVARDTYLALVRANERLQGSASELFKAHGLTQAQYNVLRILRGAGGDGLPCQAIADRLITRVPDVTRLLDRMERDGLVSRERSAEDRRVVFASITKKGQALVDSLDEPVTALHRDQFSGMAAAETQTLEALLLRLAEAP